MEIQAENLNQDKSSAACSSEAGVRPRPLRKRGFHRALKRGEAWAIQKDQYDAWMRHTHDWFMKSIFPDSPFFGLLDRSTEPAKPQESEIVGLAAWLSKDGE